MLPNNLIIWYSILTGQSELEYFDKSLKSEKTQFGHRTNQIEKIFKKII